VAPWREYFRWRGSAWPVHWAPGGSSGVGSLCDELRALGHLIDQDISGPVNLVGPQPVRQGEAMKALGAALGRPAILPAPAFALKAIMGEFAGDILGSQRVLPSVLTASGFVFDHDTIETAMRWLVEKS
jgi:hypothetical protein